MTEAKPTWLDEFSKDLDRLDMAISKTAWDSSPEVNELVRAALTLANKLRVKANTERFGVNWL